MSFDSDFKRLIKNFSNYERKQIPYAAQLALNETAKDIKKGVERQLNKDIDRPTPFTQKAFKIKWASKKKPQSSVYIKEIQEEYLQYQIEGGTRKATSDSPVLIPRKNMRNKYGNLPRGKLKRLSSQGKAFTQDRVAYQKNKRSLKPIAYFAEDATYRKRFRFYERGIKTAKKVILKNFVKAHKQAMRTAK